MTPSDDLMSIRGHLGELRKRLLICIISVLTFSLISFILWPKILVLLIPKNVAMVYISPQETVLVRLRMGMLLGFLFSVPIISLEVWGFFRPALKPGERKVISWLLVSSMILLSGGVTFSAVFILPSMLNFFLRISEPTLTPMISISNYISLALNMTLAFALASQVPIIITIASTLRIIDAKTLTSYRKGAVLGAFVLGAILTPPDAFSQVALAIPIYLLFEVGIILSKIGEKARR